MKPTTYAGSPAARRSATTYRWVRQFHLWIGAWGALAAILYGFTGLMQNHRMGDNAWPQGKTDTIAESTLAVPAEARATPEQLSLWLRETRGLDAWMIRKGKPDEGKRSEGKPGGGKPDEKQAKWNLNGGSAGNSWSIEYVPGSDVAQFKRSHSDLLAALSRLHKGNGGKWWSLLADSFAIGMMLLGVSGIWMWARGRNPKQMLLSVFGLASLLFVAMLGLALL